MSYISNKLKAEYLPLIEELSFSSSKDGDLLDRARIALQELLERAVEQEQERVAMFEYEN